ncbi:thiol-disulfide oxidoreductase DCC family protein [Arachidicoccus soli]|uniref:Thiol-disulfide oxidoreductase DCC family protein n=1 Tax=Arachidicoccus soli TaxID=2341117 RepID=A0A386HUI3_9BACT|nr:thiol-disulfide oxidoreductase DCC family protein [Arachidicoccus soli]AYD49211.1 thiol-disulfide oxidoreductase DCC family protein [Arachidicoccus soli]
MTEQAQNIVLFDGICNLCNGAVQFIIKHDKNAHFKFASLQSAVAKKLLLQYGIEMRNPPESILLIREHKIFYQSSAILHIAQRLDGAWKIATVLFIVPKFIRNFFYRLIAKNRYKWFGKKQECMLPTPALKSRFLED